MANIIRIEIGRLGGHAAGEIGITDHGDTVIGNKLFVRNSRIAVTTTLCGQVDNHRSVFHRSYHIVKPQFWRRSSRNQGGGYHDIDVGGLFAKQGELLFTKFGTGRGGIATRFRAVGLIGKVEEEKFRAH